MDFRRSRMTAPAPVTINRVALERTPVSNFWGYTSMRTSPGPHTPPTSPERHNNACFSWGCWGCLGRLACHRTSSGTSTGAQWKASWCTASQCGMQDATRKSSGCSRGSSRQHIESQGLSYQPSMTSSRPAAGAELLPSSMLLYFDPQGHRTNRLQLRLHWKL